MTGKGWIVSILVLNSIIISCNENKSAPANNRTAGRGGNRPILAEGFIVKSRALSESLEVPGTLLPYEETEIRSEISGRVVWLNIPEGSFVQKGTLLVKLFDEDLQAQLQKLQVQLQIAEKTAERQKELLKISGISQQEYDLSELQVSNLKADIELTKVSISKTEIRAPYDGRIGLKSISSGAYITPTTPITSISQVNELKLEFTVPEKYSKHMVRGRPVNFTVGTSDQLLQAKIHATESLIESNTRSLRVRATVQGNHKLLVPGAFAKVLLQFGKFNESLVVPSQSVIPQARNKQVIVYKDGKAEFVVVTTGIRDSSFVQILDGLNEGDTVLTTALLAVRPESQIKLIKVQ
jgi:RND family efflux transporter, MFP subunit